MRFGKVPKSLLPLVRPQGNGWLPAQRKELSLLTQHSSSWYTSLLITFKSSLLFYRHGETRQWRWARGREEWAAAAPLRGSAERTIPPLRIMSEILAESQRFLKSH